jgi:hypothetical protein
VALPRAHGGGKCQVLGRGARVAGTCQRQAESELGIVVGGAGLHDQTEVSGRCGILAGVELRPGQRLKYAPGPRLSSSGPFEYLCGCGRAAAAQQIQAALVELMSVITVSGYRIRGIS